jgi:EAL domain-containing protein (putative c-di-GMP-specific phosphodiesterase class I)
LNNSCQLACIFGMMDRKYRTRPRRSGVAQKGIVVSEELQEILDEGDPDKPLTLEGEPFLEYQPVIDLQTGRLLGFEGLIRWHHPTRGLISPNHLLPWAVANGQIGRLGRWVLDRACHDAATWDRSLQVAVNCSINELRRGDASVSVLSALRSSGVDPDRLTIEVTERSLTDGYAIADLQTIADYGVQLAVDDVGTNWSSFERLRKMAINTIKIDASFIQALEAEEGINRMVVETVVHLAHSAGMATVAEGVETELAAKIVREFDSDAAQGYFFAPSLDGVSAANLAADREHVFPLTGPGWNPSDGFDHPAASGDADDPADTEDPADTDDAAAAAPAAGSSRATARPAKRAAAGKGAHAATRRSTATRKPKKPAT